MIASDDVAPEHCWSNPCVILWERGVNEPRCPLFSPPPLPPQVGLAVKTVLDNMEDGAGWEAHGAAVEDNSELFTEDPVAKAGAASAAASRRDATEVGVWGGCPVVGEEHLLARGLGKSRKSCNPAMRAGRKHGWGLQLRTTRGCQG